MCSRFKKTYRDEAEKVRRLSIFKDTYKRVAEWNRARDTCDPDAPHYVTNHLSDWTEEEKLRLHHSHKQPGFREHHMDVRELNATEFLTGSDLPSAWDWRDQGVVTGVKDQGGLTSG